MSEEENIFQKRTSRLLRGLQLAAASQSEKTYRGYSPDKKVSAKVNGRHEVESIRIDHKEYGLSKKKGEELEGALKEAVGRALNNSQAAAKKVLEENTSR